ncbi:DNA repair protein RecO [Acidipila sp. EB88]|nr:DNA repair protein RecO [Acidipila sp. EB88]RRA49875.1 DNA repair protein RecO [Acidipila sp. EB88]
MVSPWRGALTEHSYEAVVLRTWPIREADLIVSFFTREAGKVKGVAKSAAKSRRRFGGALEPMTHVRAHYTTRPRQELVRLDSFEILHSPLREPADYGRAAALAFFTEVLDEMLPDHDPQDATFRLLLHVLEQTRVDRIWMPVTYFALWMVRLMGWMPDLRQCTVCGRPFEAQGPAYWHPDGDGLLCAEHRKLGSMTMSPASRLLAEQLFHAPAERFAAAPWPRSRAADLRRFAMQSLERHGEQRLQSVGALARLGG